MRPARPARTRTHHESTRLGDAQIHQEGSRFGPAQVSRGALFQGNAVGIPISKPLWLTVPSVDAHDAQTLRLRPGPTMQGSFCTPLSNPSRRTFRETSCTTRSGRSPAIMGADESTKTLIVRGLGEAGKTQLVLDCVRQHRTDYKATFWMEAGRKESLERDFVHLYYKLFGLQMAPGTETVSVEDAVTGVKSWFSGKRGPRLMVFDGADAVKNSESSGYLNIEHFIPNLASLHLIKSRVEESRYGTGQAIPLVD